jgi:ABC-type nickel/cobalt efflux system permease component RcnA
MHPTVRQLVSLWLVIVIALLPVSGTLLAATLAPASDQGTTQIHLDQGHHAMQAHHGHDHARHGAVGPPAEHGTQDIAQLPSSLHHDCGDALCASVCTGCTGCHAPPATLLASADSENLVCETSPVVVTTPPHGALYRPPRDTAA